MVGARGRSTELFLWEDTSGALTHLVGRVLRETPSMKQSSTNEPIEDKDQGGTGDLEGAEEMEKALQTEGKACDKAWRECSLLRELQGAQCSQTKGC